MSDDTRQSADESDLVSLVNVNRSLREQVSVLQAESDRRAFALAECRRKLEELASCPPDGSVAGFRLRNEKLAHELGEARERERSASARVSVLEARVLELEEQAKKLGCALDYERMPWWRKWVRR